MRKLPKSVLSERPPDLPDGWKIGPRGSRVPDAQRVESIERSLKDGKALSDEERCYLSGVLDWVLFRLMVEEQESKRGRRQSFPTFFFAYVAHQLIERHGASPGAAVRAAVGDHSHLTQTVARTLRKLRRSDDGFKGLQTDPKYVEEAAARLAQITHGKK